MASGSLQVPVQRADSETTDTSVRGSGAGTAVAGAVRKTAVPEGLGRGRSGKPERVQPGDLARLERAVAALVAEHENLTRDLAAQAKEFTALASEHSALTAEHAALIDAHATISKSHTALTREHTALCRDHEVIGRKLDETMKHGRSLEERLQAESQRRKDALKRIDEVIRQLGRLTPDAAGPASSGA